MRISLMLTAALLPLCAIANSRCITLEGSTLINGCRACAEITVHALRAPAEQSAGTFTGKSRAVRLEAGARETLQDERWAITDLAACR